MSENLPYHDEQWDDLPLPNREKAWQNMQRKLEEGDKRRRLFPFWFWRYVLSGILVAGTATGGYWLLKRNANPPAGRISARPSLPLPENENVATAQKKFETNPDSLVNRDPERKMKAAVTTPVLSHTTGEENPHPVQQSLLHQPKKRERQNLRVGKAQTRKKNLPLTVMPERMVDQAGERSTRIQPASVADSTGLKSKPESTVPAALHPHRDTHTNNDSINVATALPADSSNMQKEKPQKKSRIVFSAGIGLQHAIALNGQQTTSYALNGKQNKFSGFISSVYLRLQKGHWYLQGELHYKAPQPVRPFAFSQLTAYDAASNLLSTEQLFVQKMYYHQVSLGVHHFVRPQWSVGTGVVYNRFAGVVTTQNLTTKNLITGGETIATQVVPLKGFKDSFLYKSTTALLLQTDYHWRRISFGFRYTKNLQSFIKYTRPDGAVRKEENNLLQAILRFRLF